MDLFAVYVKSKDKKLAKVVHEPNFSRVDLVMTLMVYVYIHSFRLCVVAKPQLQKVSNPKFLCFVM